MTAPANDLRSWLRAAQRVARAMVGAPDYERYVAHLRARHPGETPLDRETFEREHAAARYGRPGSRCC